MLAQGFHKILKKHDKVLPHAPCQQFYVAHLHHQPWVQVREPPQPTLYTLEMCLESDHLSLDPILSPQPACHLAANCLHYHPGTRRHFFVEGSCTASRMNC